MAIKDLELFHGVVLTKLIRSERPLSLKMIQFNADQSSSAYLVNDEVVLFIKHSKSPRERQRKGYDCAWLFTFNPEHLQELRSLSADKQVYAALVCGDKQIENSCMQVCFLLPNELTQCIDLHASQNQSISVANVQHGKLRVWGSERPAKDPLLVNKAALENWEVPGS